MSFSKDTLQCILLFFIFILVGLQTTYASDQCVLFLDTVQKIEESSNLKREGTLKLSGQRQMHYTTFNLVDPNQPVLLFFPGIYSALESNSEFFKYLESKNIPYVTFSFSSHPRSIITLDLNEELPSFSNLSTKDLADEVVALVESLELKKPVAVTTSYSSTLTSYLPENLFPKVIDTAPMGRLREDHELQFYVADVFNLMTSFVPTSHGVYQQLIKQSYYSYWKNQVNFLMKYYDQLENEDLNRSATYAYIAMIKAVEKYDIRKLDFTMGPERIFVLASDESPKRLHLQNQAIIIAEQQLGYKPEVYTIEDADHIIAYSQPQRYADLLIHLLNNL